MSSMVGYAGARHIGRTVRPAAPIPLRRAGGPLGAPRSLDLYMPIRLYSPAMDVADGLLEEHEGRWRLRFERRLAHPPERVWRGGTEARDPRAGFPFATGGDCAAGAPLRFVFRDGEAEPFEGRMIDFDAPRALELERGGGERRAPARRPGGGL